jgi:hypothetical protein
LGSDLAQLRFKLLDALLHHFEMLDAFLHSRKRLCLRIRWSSSGLGRRGRAHHRSGRKGQRHAEILVRLQLDCRGRSQESFFAGNQRVAARFQIRRHERPIRTADYVLVGVVALIVYQHLGFRQGSAIRP